MYDSYDSWGDGDRLRDERNWSWLDVGVNRENDPVPELPTDSCRDGSKEDADPKGEMFLDAGAEVADVLP